MVPSCLRLTWPVTCSCFVLWKTWGQICRTWRVCCIGTDVTSDRAFCSSSSGLAVEEDASYHAPSCSQVSTIYTKYVNPETWLNCVKNAFLQIFVCLSLGALKCEIKKEPAKLESDTATSTLSLESLPPCHVGCTEFLLGFLNTQQEIGVEDLLKVKCLLVYYVFY